ncbi:MAG TPA: molybdenum cofactor guanylyltransferase [Pyrinomonadaceae bacterium]|nr:molybdenum cofactor guanylyltransferase [Pyrinomonadaceae bacterium]
MNQDNFTGFVLAGGKSSRMGADKYSLETGGETFLARAVNVLRPVCKTVKIVLNDDQDIETDQPVIRDIYKGHGAPGGIHAALKHCETKFAVILAVDLPNVSTGAIVNLTNIALASNKYIAFVPRQTDGRPQPLCAVYRAKYCLPSLEKLLAENDSVSVKDFLDQILPKYIEAKRLGADENLLFNVNSPDDFYTIHPLTD